MSDPISEAFDAWYGRCIREPDTALVRDSMKCGFREGFRVARDAAVKALPLPEVAYEEDNTPIEGALGYNRCLNEARAALSASEGREAGK